MLSIIVTTSYVMSVLSFLLFLYFALRRPPAPEQGAASDMPDLSDVAKVLEALAKLTDSFAKAGPAVMSLVASIFFLLIAALGSGFDRIATGG